MRLTCSSWALAICASAVGMIPLASAETVQPVATPIAFRAAAPALAPVPLGWAGNFAILSKAGITTTGDTAIAGGGIGVSPITSTAITGFTLTMHSSNTFSTSSQVIGRVFASNYASPTPSMLTTAVGHMQTAYNNAAGRLNPTAINMGGGNIGGLVIPPGLYKWTTGVIVPGNVVLSGNKDAVWIFQIAGTLNIANGKKVTLSGGAQSKNVFWQVAGATTLGTTSFLTGTVLGKTGIVLKTGARLNGRALAQTNVTLDANAIQRPPL
jgi:hypothetical protein